MASRGSQGTFYILSKHRMKQTLNLRFTSAWKEVSRLCKRLVAPLPGRNKAIIRTATSTRMLQTADTCRIAAAQDLTLTRMTASMTAPLVLTMPIIPLPRAIAATSKFHIPLPVLLRLRRFFLIEGCLIQQLRARQAIHPRLQLRLNFPARFSFHIRSKYDLRLSPHSSITINLISSNIKRRYYLVSAQRSGCQVLARSSQELIRPLLQHIDYTHFVHCIDSFPFLGFWG